MRRQRLGLERLENRLMLSRISWDGGGGNANWDNPLNWDTDVLPGAGDDVTVAAGAPGGSSVVFTSGSS
jgi:hypothetical protein